MMEPGSVWKWRVYDILAFIVALGVGAFTLYQAEGRSSGHVIFCFKLAGGVFIFLIACRVVFWILTGRGGSQEEADSFFGGGITFLEMLFPENYFGRVGHWILDPIGRSFGRLFYPDEEVIPPADYTLTKVYRERGEFDKAAERCFFILEYHPREIRAYREGIAYCFLSGDPAAAQKLLTRARKTFVAPEDLDLLKQVEEAYRKAEAIESDFEGRQAFFSCTPGARSFFG